MYVPSRACPSVGVRERSSRNRVETTRACYDELAYYLTTLFLSRQFGANDLYAVFHLHLRRLLFALLAPVALAPLHTTPLNMVASNGQLSNGVNGHAPTKSQPSNGHSAAPSDKQGEFVNSIHKLLCPFRTLPYHSEFVSTLLRSSYTHVSASNKQADTAPSRGSLRRWHVETTRASLCDRKNCSLAGP